MGFRVRRFAFRDEVTLFVGGEGREIGLEEFAEARALVAVGEEAVVFVDPARVVLASAVYVALAGDGVKLGADPFGPYAVDGELPLWTLAAVAHEVEAAVRLFRDVLPGIPSVGFALPGPEPVCGEGDYLYLLSAAGWPVYGWPGAAEREGVIPTSGEPGRRVA